MVLDKYKPIMYSGNTTFEQLKEKYTLTEKIDAAERIVRLLDQLNTDQSYYSKQFSQTADILVAFLERVLIPSYIISSDKGSEK